MQTTADPVSLPRSTVAKSMEPEPSDVRRPSKWLTSPDPDETGWPKGVKYIIGNEGAERFSYYGMKAILWLYVAMLYQDTGLAQKAAEDNATALVHLFGAAVYALPMIGAIVADRLLGKYHTILYLSLVYCGGHAVLSATEGTTWGMYVGLGLIAVGAGGIKPCVSAHVGDQFGKSNWHRLRTMYQIFYFIINFGSMFSQILTPWLRAEFGWTVAFAVPGVLMGVATLFFWMGRKVFIHVPAQPGGKLGLLDATAGSLLFMTVGSLFFVGIFGGVTTAILAACCFVSGLGVFMYRQRIQQDDSFLAVTVYTVKSWFTGENTEAARDHDDTDVPKALAAATKKFGSEATIGAAAVVKILTIFVFVSPFWAVFDQTASSWIRQAKDMKLEVFGMFTMQPDQMQAMNPAMVMILIPFTAVILYPFMDRIGLKMTPLRRMSIGMFMTVVACAMVAGLQMMVESGVEAGEKVSILWQSAPYLVLTLAEVMVSITGLEFAYTQAPKRLKSTIMGWWLMSVALGNVIVALVAKLGGLEFVAFLWAFAGIMLAAAIGFTIRAAFYKTREFN